MKEMKQIAQMIGNVAPDNILDSVPIPAGLDAKQIKMAKHLVTEQMKEGYTIGGFCKEFGISTKTFYEWKEVPAFSKYLTALSGAIIPDDEMQAYQMMKKHVSRLAYKQNPTPKEVELFMDVYGYLVEHDKKVQSEKLGLNKTPSDMVDNRTLEERKTALLSRLRS